MFMPTINYFRLIICEYDSANRNEAIGNDTKVAKESYEGLPVYQLIKINAKR